MIRALLILFSMTFSHVVSFSQINPAEQYPPKNWELGFAIGPDFTLGSFQGSFISISKYLTENEKLRFGLSSELSGSETEINLTRHHMDTLYASNKFPDEYNRRFVRFSIQYSEYLPKSRTIKPYYVFGPFLSLTSNNDTDNWISGDLNTSYVRRNKTEMIMVGVGVSGGVGAEWELTEAISIHAEYQFGFGYYWGNTETTLTSHRTRYGMIDSESKVREVMKNDTSEWLIKGYGVLFGLSLAL